MTDLEAPWSSPEWIERVARLLDSYDRWLGKTLIERSGDARDDARRIWEAPFVVVAHGTEPDPILNYGNRIALNLWEMDVASFTSTPSRRTAEPLHRDERARMLERTTRDGYIDDYQGIRISSTGQRFLIRRAIVWNVVDDAGNRIGQAATFAAWEALPSNDAVSPRT